MTPATAASPAPTAEYQHEDPRHVVAEHRHHVRMGQRGLDDEPDAGARSA